jgi:hypothetical protein
MPYSITQVPGAITAADEYRFLKLFFTTKKLTDTRVEADGNPL